MNQATDQVRVRGGSMQIDELHQCHTPPVSGRSLRGSVRRASERARTERISSRFLTKLSSDSVLNKKTIWACCSCIYTGVSSPSPPLACARRVQVKGWAHSDDGEERSRRAGRRRRRRRCVRSRARGRRRSRSTSSPGRPEARRGAWSGHDGGLCRWVGCCCSHDDDHAKRPRALAEVGGHKGERRSARPFTTHSWVSGNARSSRERDETTSDKPRFALQLQLQLQLYSLVTTNPITTVLYF